MILGMEDVEHNLEVHDEHLQGRIQCTGHVSSHACLTKKISVSKIIK